MRHIVFMAFGVIFIALAVAPVPKRENDAAGAAPPIAEQSETLSAAAIIAEGEAIVRRGPNGHFTAQASVNGAAMTMIFDSGASVVVLDRDDAMAAGISVFPHEFTGSAQTAGGRVKTKPVLLDRVSFAGIERRNVRGAVVDADLPAALLGQSFLSQLANVSVAGDEMRMR